MPLKRKTEPRSKAWMLMTGLMLGFVLLHAIGQLSSAPPAALPTDAPDDQFSAMRAFKHVEQIAQAPHPTGSAENAAVRAYLVETLQTLGLQVEVQQQLVTYRYQRYPHEARFANVTNVIGRLRGSAGGGKHLLLMSHYDSRDTTPGAGDAASGVATLLETARALTHRPAPSNDVVFLFTDGEEIGLMGAQAYFRHHPQAAETGFVLNFDARGSRGTAYMFQTSDPAAPLIDLMQQEVAKPWANSLSLAAYKQIPNDTDMSISLQSGVPGMNFAFIDGFFDYHEATDTIEHLSTATLQHLGDYALPLAARLANEDLGQVSANAAERTFFFVPGLGLIDYPAWLDLAGAGLLILVLLSLITRLRWESRLSVWQFARGWLVAVLALLLPLILIAQLQAGLFSGSGMHPVLDQLAQSEWLWWSYSALALSLSIWLLLSAVRGRGSLPLMFFAFTVAIAQFVSGALQSKLAIAAVVLVVIGVLAVARKLPSAAVIGGFALLGLLATAGLAWGFPAALFLIVWPLLLPALWWLLAGIEHQKPLPVLAITVLTALPAALILIPFAHALYIMLSVMSAAPAMLMLIWALFCLLPLCLTRDLRKPAALLCTLGLAAALIAATLSPFNGRFPAPANVFTVQTDTQSLRVTPDTRLTDWHREVLGESPVPVDGQNYTPSLSKDLRGTPTDLPKLDGAKIERLALTQVSGNDFSTLKIQLEMPEGVSQLQLYVPAVLGLQQWRVDGEALSPPDQTQQEWHQLKGYAPSTRPIQIEVDIVNSDALPSSEIVLAAYHPEPNGDLALPAKPHDLMRAPYSYADGVLVVQRFSAQPVRSADIAADSFEQDAAAAMPDQDEHEPDQDEAADPPASL